MLVNQNGRGCEGPVIFDANVYIHRSSVGVVHPSSHASEAQRCSWWQRYTFNIATNVKHKRNDMQFCAVGSQHIVTAVRWVEPEGIYRSRLPVSTSSP